tara:strand:- start:487 stop:726 length:240 start_codon:yes stop_codon:yes gene_type:complete
MENGHKKIKIVTDDGVTDVVLLDADEAMSWEFQKREDAVEFAIELECLLTAYTDDYIERDSPSLRSWVIKARRHNQLSQ